MEKSFRIYFRRSQPNLYVVAKFELARRLVETVNWTGSKIV